MSNVKSETPETYNTSNKKNNLSDNEILELAREIARKKIKGMGVSINGVEQTAALLHSAIGNSEKELFYVMFLNNKNIVISEEVLFTGTIDSCAVHPREIAKRALELNSNAVILAHNHPAGDPTPSMADKNITVRIKDVLSMLDVRLLDHLIVGTNPDKYKSFAELGLL